MMFDLLFDVIDGLGDLRNANAEDAVALLPGKVLQIGESLMYPARRSCFYQLNSFRNGHRSGQREEKMNMIGYSAYTLRKDSVLSGNAAHVWPEAIPDIRSQHGHAFFCGEYAVDIQPREGVRHTGDLIETSSICKQKQERL